MKNGTSQAVLVRDLLTSDGPHESIADDFIAGRCTLCERPVEHERPFTFFGHLCEGCVARG